MTDLPQINFTRLRLSGSPASSPRIVDAPASPTRSVYLDMDETTPTSPQAPLAFAYHGGRNKTPTTPMTMSNGQPNGSSSATVRRTNFFDDDSSDDDNDDGGANVRLSGGVAGPYGGGGGGTSFLNIPGRNILPGGYPSTTDDDEDDDREEEEEALTTADELAFSQRHSLVNDDYDHDDYDFIHPAADRHRGRTRTRSPGSSTGAAAAATATRKGAYYLGVRPEEYAFVCGTRPESSLRDDDGVVGMDATNALLLRHGGGGEGLFESPHATLLSESVSPKHVPFGPPDIAVAARRVREEQRRGVGMLKVPRHRASSSIFPSASEYEGDGDASTVEVGGGGVKDKSVSCGDAGSAGAGGKPAMAASKVPDMVEEKGDGAAAETQSLQGKTDDNILGVHAITLQALLRDEEGLQASASSVRRKSVSSEYSRKEFLKSKFAPQPGDSATSLPPPVPDIPPMAQIQQPKRVSLVPPPIDTSRPGRSKSEGKIRTPYPFNHHRSFPKTLGSPGLPPPRAKDAVLTLSIRRRRGVLSSRVARVTLPAELLESTSAGRYDDDDVAPDEQPPPVFDDADFFKQLRIEYAHLAGRWWRFFSARSLRRITVGHTTAWSTTESCPSPAACGGGRCCPAARAAHGGALQQQQQRGCSAATPSGIYHVRSPRFLASQGLKDTFSEENLLAHFRKPRLGRSRFAWVLWAGRLAGLHEQPDLFGARTRPRQSHHGDWRDRDLPPTPTPTPGGGRAGEATGRTPSTASTALAGWSEVDGKDDAVVSAAELGLAGAIGPGHSIATLEFVEDWSIARVLVAVLLVLLLAAAGIVLWILFGTGALVEGFRGSGARVGTAVLVGAGVLMLGWTLVLAWMGVSWCVV